MSDLNELKGLIERIVAAQEKLGDDDVVYSLPNPAGHPTGKHGTFLRPEDITSEMIGARVKTALQKRVGRRREYGVADLASYILASEKTAQKYMDGDTPSSLNIWRLIAFFGPEFASELLAPLGMAVVESDSAHASQCLSIEGLMTMLPQLRNLAETLESTLQDEGDNHE